MASVIKKDDKVELLSFDEFLKWTSHFEFFETFYVEEGKPLHHYHNFLITKKYFVDVFVKRNLNIFAEIFGGKDWNIDSIKYAKRDRALEKKVIDGEIERIAELSKTKKLHHMTVKKLERYKKVKQTLEIVDAQEEIKKESQVFKKIEDFKCRNEELASRYLVLDVETNGLRKARDDLLSISIFDPYSGVCYNRYLPLDLQPIVLTSDINGITTSQLDSCSHISQQELDEVFEKFNIKNRTVLTYSGGTGEFDKAFFENYCKRHKLIGYEDIVYENIKSRIPDGGYQLSNQLSKDNICEKLGIKGVSNIHSSLNDCLLEWKLFENIFDKQLFFIDCNLYQYRKDYIAPISYLTNNISFRKAVGMPPFNKVGVLKEIFNFEFSEADVRKLKKYPTNITGIAFEHALNSRLNVKKEDNTEFLKENKSKLSLLCSFESNYQRINVSFNCDGTLGAVEEKDKSFIEDVNMTTDYLIGKIDSIIDFVGNNIFNGSTIISQELVIHDDRKVLALCDLSNEQNVIEIKTFGVVDSDGNLKSSIAEQLYYEAKGRNAFCLSLEFKEHRGVTNFHILDGVSIKIYRVIFEDYVPKPRYEEYVLGHYEIAILNAIASCPTITNKELMKKVRCGMSCINFCLYRLKMLRYIENVGNKRYRNFAILRSSDDTRTRYEIYEGNIKILS